LRVVVLGFAYAQAEDNFWRIEDNYIRSLGRLADPGSNWVTAETSDVRRQMSEFRHDHGQPRIGWP